MNRTKGLFSALAAGIVYDNGMFFALGAVPAWWELVLVCGTGAFCSPVVWAWMHGMWLVVLEARPENRLKDEQTQAMVDQIFALRGEPAGEPLKQDESLRLTFFCVSLLWLFASRGLLVGTALWTLRAWLSA